MKKTRVTTYSLSAVAIVCFFLYPDPKIALSVALMIQTLAFIIIAGKSFADGLLLVGISTILMGAMPSEHPLVSGSESYKNIRFILIVLGALIVLMMLAIIVHTERKGIRQKREESK